MTDFNGLKPIEQLERKFAELPVDPTGKRWECPTCGVMEPKLLKFGNIERWIRQSCACEVAERDRKKREEERQAWLKAAFAWCYSWLGDSRWSDMVMKEKMFQNFDQTVQPLAYEVARAFCGHPSGSLVLHGSFGTGKTHLLAAICNASIRERSIRPRFTTAPKFFAAIQARIQADEQYSGLISIAMRAPLLVIDDIDKAKHTEFREEVYFEIIDERVKNGLPTAISTNRLSELANFVGGAVCSRFKVGQLDVEMVGQDYREAQQ